MARRIEKRTRSPSGLPDDRTNFKRTSIIAKGLPIFLFGLWQRGGFDGLYGQDAYAYFSYASGPLTSAIKSSQPLPPFFWPPGYPLLIFAATQAVGSTPAAAQWVSLLAGTAIPILTALIALEIWNQPYARPIAILAAMITGFVPQLWQSSVVVMADTPALAAATLGIWALVRYRNRVMNPSSDANKTSNWQSLAWLLLSGAGLSFAVLTRWAYALVAIPVAFYTLNVWRSLGPRRSIPHLLIVAPMVLLIIYPVANPALRSVLDNSNGEHQFVGDLRVYSWSPANAVNRQFETADGLLKYRLPNGLYYGLLPAHRYFFTPLLAVFLLLGVWILVRQIRPGTALLLAWAAFIYAFHAGAPWQNFRFSLAYLPPLGLIAAAGFVKFDRRAPTVGKWVGRTLLIFGLCWMAFGGWQLTETFVDRKNANLTRMAEVAKRLPASGTLITFGLTGAFQHYHDFEVVELFSADERMLGELLTERAEVFILADEQVIRTQWRNRAPEINLTWLQHNAHLEHLADLPPYTLWQVAG